MNKKPEHRLTFGIMVAPVPPWQRVMEHAGLVESLCFDKLWVPDHFVNPEDKDMDWFDCWTSLTGMATGTKNIVLGTLVSSMTLRNPAILARMALTLDHISGGRLELGVGAAGTKNCHSMTGVPRWDPRERSDRYREYIEILDHLLKGELTTYPGKFYNIQEAQMRPGFIAKPRPVFNVAAHGPKALRLAAKYGDAWNCYNPGKNLTPKQNSEVTRQRYDMFCEFASEFGRDPAQIGRTFLYGWTSDGLFRSMDAFEDTILRYVEAGMNDFCFLYALGIDVWKDNTITTEDLLRRIALEAIPAIREKFQTKIPSS
jgi:alkanesulfonate monooxygenase SsuD/methylene tetrahydromethanopterin reductase-like flavin-dependent oxidoreductase (luciferase family)